MSNNLEKNHPISKSPYISCIRIHGLRILPPVLTDEKRHRMQYYKQLAVKVEEKIKNKRLANESTDSTDDSQSARFINSNFSTTSDSLSSSSDEEPTYKSQIFSESCRSDIIKMLTDIPSTEILNVPLRDNSENKCLNKSMILPESDKNILVEKMNAENDKSCDLYDTHLGCGDEEIAESPPRLIRSNSYTLEYPSPFLLALLKKKNECPPNVTQTDTNLKKRRTWDFRKAKEKWSSIENDLNNFKRPENFASLPSSARTSPDKKMFNARLEFPEKEFEISTILHPDIRRPSTATEKRSKRFIQSLITPTRSQKPEKDTEHPKKTEVLFSQKKEIILPKKPNILSYGKSEIQIRAIIDKIHSEQSIQMSDLIARQKKEQENLMKYFAEQQALLFSKIQNSNQDICETIDERSRTQSKTYETPIENIKTLSKETATIVEIDNTQSKIIENNKILSITSEVSEETTLLDKTKLDRPFFTVSEPNILKSSENLLSECKKIFVHNSNLSTESSSVTAFSNPEDTLNDITLISCIPSPEILSRNDNSSNNFSFDSVELVSNGSSGKNTQIKRNSACSRRLFPTREQMWAATTINAGARGYLVRRLIKTDRVQNLIKTIRDTLLCAMQLHHETAEKIQPADVELHRRLILQVTAACYSFHDTFFELSISEQLYIISTDRARQKEKLLRPVSARSSTSVTSTTQKVLERKLNRQSSDSAGGTPSRCSSSRSCYSAGEFRDRPKSVGLLDSVQSSRKTSPQNGVMLRSMTYVANKKPWR